MPSRCRGTSLALAAGAGGPGLAKNNNNMFKVGDDRSEPPPGEC